MSKNCPSSRGFSNGICLLSPFEELLEDVSLAQKKHDRLRKGTIMIGFDQDSRMLNVASHHCHHISDQLYDEADGPQNPRQRDRAIEWSDITGEKATQEKEGKTCNIT